MAAELQAGERDPGEALSKDELLQLGRDVGIPGKFLEQAVIEEQTRMPAQVLDGFWEVGKLQRQIFLAALSFSRSI